MSLESRRPRPIALTFLWIILMAPLSLAGTALQPHTPLPYDVFPLVMVGPALAALICALTVPYWFPEPVPAASRRLLSLATIGTIVAGAVLLLVLAAGLTGGAAFLPESWPKPIGIVAVILGLSLGGLLEEIGYRGVMYRALSARMGPVLAVLVNGVFFGICHLQYFGAGFLAVALFVLSAVFMDIAMVALWTGSWAQRVLLASLYHGIVNVSLALIGDSMTSLRAFTVLALANAAAAVIAVLFGKWKRIGDFSGRPAAENANTPHVANGEH